jgi:tetratricopeptide (TPR) repeat protein
MLSVEDFEMAAFHYNRGLELEKKGRYEDALAAFDLAVRFDSEDTEAHIRRGMLLFELKRHAEAGDAFRIAMSRRSGDLTRS